MESVPQAYVSIHAQLRLLGRWLSHIRGHSQDGNIAPPRHRNLRVRVGRLPTTLIGGTRAGVRRAYIGCLAYATNLAPALLYGIAPYCSRFIMQPSFGLGLLLGTPKPAQASEESGDPYRVRSRAYVCALGVSYLLGTHA